ncbi:MAG: hypothetical protein ABIJ10_03855 [Candidatus Micrarchaeota archaeon]
MGVSRIEKESGESVDPSMQRPPKKRNLFARVGGKLCLVAELMALSFPTTGCIRNSRNTTDLGNTTDSRNTTDINHNRGIFTMATHKEVRRDENEDRAILRDMAVSAATHFRDYILTGNETDYSEFTRIYNENRNNTNFRPIFEDELDSRVLNDTAISPLWEAYRHDISGDSRGRTGAPSPVEFLQAVRTVRARFDASNPSQAEVDRLVAEFNETAEGARGTTRVEQVRTYTRTGMPLADAALSVLQDDLRHGSATGRQVYRTLTDAMGENLPAERARRAVFAFRDFVLTGNPERASEFDDLFDTSGDAFISAFATDFSTYITNGTDSALGAIVLEYARNHGGIDQFSPRAFITFVMDLTRAAQRGEVARIQELQRQEGNLVVDGLISIVARGMARRATSLYSNIVLNESSLPPTELAVMLRDFSEIYDSTFVRTSHQATDSTGALRYNADGSPIMEAAVDAVRIAANPDFSNEYNERYSTDRGGIMRGRANNQFQRNGLPIAIRDIYVELTRQDPDVARLILDYGENLVLLVRSQLPNLGWMLRSDEDLSTLLRRRAIHGDATARAFMRVELNPDNDRVHALREVYGAYVTARSARHRSAFLTVADLRFLGATSEDIASVPLDSLNRLLEQLEGRGHSNDRRLIGRLEALLEGTGLTVEEVRTRFQNRRWLEQQFAEFGATTFIELQSGQNTAAVLMRAAENEDHPQHALALAIITRFGDSREGRAEAVRTITEMYDVLQPTYETEAHHTQTYGNDFTTFVLEHGLQLSWVVISADDVGFELNERSDEEFVSGMHTDPGIGFAWSTSSHAIHDIYSAHGNTGQLNLLRARYGETFVEFIENPTNRALLSWVQVNGQMLTPEQIETELRRRRGVELSQTTNEPQLPNGIMGFIYGMNPVQIAAAVVQTRVSMASVRGSRYLLDDMADRYGPSFTYVLVPSTLGQRSPRSVNPIVVSAQIDRNYGRIREDLDDLRRAISRHPQLSALSELFEVYIRGWEQENLDIRDSAATDPAFALEMQQGPQGLIHTILNTTEMGNAIDMAYLMLQLVQTGGGFGDDANTGDRSDLRRRFEWYDTLSPSKQRMVADIVYSVLGNIDEPLRGFISSMGGHNNFSALRQVAGALALNRDNDAIAAFEYGDAFTAEVRRQYPHLAFVTGTDATESMMGPVTQVGEENALFASILARTYLALTQPTDTENEAAMVDLFGAPWVAAVRSQLEALAPLVDQTLVDQELVNAEEHRASAIRGAIDRLDQLSDETRAALVRAYSYPYSSVSSTLTRSLNQSNVSMISVLREVYRVVSNPPAENAPASETEAYNVRRRGLVARYGERLVHAVQVGTRDLGFLGRSTDAESQVALSALNASDATPDRRRLYATLCQAFDDGARDRIEFMANFRSASTRIPHVYQVLRDALSFSSDLSSGPLDNVGGTEDDGAGTQAGSAMAGRFAAALQTYRDQLGNDNFLISRYFNLQMLTPEVLRNLMRRYGAEGTLPERLRENGVQTAEDLLILLQSPVGRALVQGGIEAYDELERQYLAPGQGIDPSIADEVEGTALETLRSNLTILDALYLGISLESLSSPNSEFGRRAGRALMNSMLLIGEHDPYLLGPFILQVIPTFISVTRDEMALEALITSFNSMFTTTYGRGGRVDAYGMLQLRTYWLAAFDRIEERLQYGGGTMDELQDRMRRTPEPGRSGGYDRLPGGVYAQRSLMENIDDNIHHPPRMFARGSRLMRIAPHHTRVDPDAMFLPSATGFAVSSGAVEHHARLEAQLRPGEEPDQTGRIPARYQIGFLRSASLVSALGRLVGSPPSNFNTWLLGHDVSGGLFATASGNTDDSGSVNNEEGGRVIGVHRGIGGANANEELVVRRRASERTTGDGEDQHDSSRSDWGTETDINVRSLGSGATGVRYFNLAFDQEILTGTDTETPEGGGAAEETDIPTEYHATGLLSTYARILSNEEREADMLIFVLGRDVPNTAEGAEQGDQDVDLTARAYILTREGNIYQVATHFTPEQVANYFYFGTTRDDVLASFRFVGDALRSGEDGVRGFDGAAFGVPLTGGRAGQDEEAQRRGDERPALLTLANIVRRLGTMEPTEAQEALGVAVPRVLTDATGRARARNVYAGFIRTGQGLALNSGGESEAIDGLTQLTGEFLWTHVGLNPREQSWELRVGVGVNDRDQRVVASEEEGGLETTEDTSATPVVYASFQHEIPDSDRIGLRHGWGLAAGYADIELMEYAQQIVQDADMIYQRAQTGFASGYYWQHDEERNAGFLVAASYLYSRLEERAAELEAEGQHLSVPFPHYGSLVTMWYARRHNMLIGVERMPAHLRGMVDVIDETFNAMQTEGGAAGTSGMSREQNAQRAISRLRSMMESDEWTVTLAYGYNGRTWGLHAIVSADVVTTAIGLDHRTTDSEGDDALTERPYGDAAILAVFGRPARGFADLVGHLHYESMMLFEESGEDGSVLHVRRGAGRPYLDLYLGGGWSTGGIRGRHRIMAVEVEPTADRASALLDCYSSLGSSPAYNDGNVRRRLRGAYGNQVPALVQSHGGTLDWLVRSAADIDADLVRMRRRRRDHNPLADGVRSHFSTNAGERLRELYIALRSEPLTRARRTALEDEYGATQVNWVESHGSELASLMLISPAGVRARLEDEPGAPALTPDQRTTAEALSGVALPQPPINPMLTGAEVQSLFEQNLADMLPAITGDVHLLSANPGRYQIVLGDDLVHQATRAAERGTAIPTYTTLYVIVPNPHEPTSEPSADLGPIIVGSEADYRIWAGQGRRLGVDVRRVEIQTDEDGYRFTFSGSDRTRWFSGGRVQVGFPVPITEDGRSGFVDAGEYIRHNWTGGLVLDVLSDERQQWLLGVLLGQREYRGPPAEGEQEGSGEQWTQVQVTLSARFREAMLSGNSDEIHGYLYFNYTNRSIVMVTDEQYQAICEGRFSECQDVSPSRRMTGGIGFTWRRSEAVSGDSTQLDIFAEAGAERRVRAVPGEAPEQHEYPVANAGLDLRIRRGSLRDNELGIQIIGGIGIDPSVNGEVTSPETLAAQERLGREGEPGQWGIMINLRIRR